MGSSKRGMEFLGDPVLPELTQEHALQRSHVRDVLTVLVREPHYLGNCWILLD